MNPSLDHPGQVRAGRNRTHKTLLITKIQRKLSTRICSFQTISLRNTSRLDPQSRKTDNTDSTSTITLSRTSPRKSTRSIQRLAWRKTLPERRVTSSHRKSRRPWAQCPCKKTRNTNRRGASLTHLLMRVLLSLSTKERAWSRVRHSARPLSGPWHKKTQAEPAEDAVIKSWETTRILSKEYRLGLRILSPTLLSRIVAATLSGYLRIRFKA